MTLDELVALIEEALRGDPRVLSQGAIDDEPGCIGIETEGGDVYFIKAEPA